MILNFPNSMQKVSYIANLGDYFLTVCPSTSDKSEVLVIHHLSKSASQKPFNKSKGLI
jgi:hypothetical protein